MYISKIKLSKEETSDMKFAIGRDWQVVTNYLHDVSEELTKIIGYKVNIFPSVAGDVSFYIITIESKSLSAVKSADKYIRNKVLNKWEE